MDRTTRGLMEMLVATQGSQDNAAFVPVGPKDEDFLMAGALADGAAGLAADIAGMLARGRAEAKVAQQVLMVPPVEVVPDMPEGLEALRPLARDFVARWNVIEPGLVALESLARKIKAKGDEVATVLRTPPPTGYRTGWR